MSSSGAGASFDFQQAVMIITALRQAGMWDAAIRAADLSEVRAVHASCYA